MPRYVSTPWRARIGPAIGCVLGAVMLGALLIGGAVSAAPTVPVGQATVIGPNGNVASPAVNAGGSQDQWELNLPSNSACTKDTNTGNYHVFTFVAPTSVDPTTLTYGSSGPADPAKPPNAFVYPLADFAGNPFNATNTVAVSAIVPNPQPAASTANFSWATFSPDGTTPAGPATANPLPVGAYNVGIACADNLGNADKIWDVVVTFSASTSDPNKETWVAANASVGGTTTTTSSTTSTTAPGGTTTTTSTTTPAGGTTTTSTAVPLAATPTSQGSGALAITGGRVMSLSQWAGILIVVGLAAALFAGWRRRADGSK